VKTTAKKRNKVLLKELIHPMSLKNEKGFWINLQISKINKKVALKIKRG
jgi:hypothetical protein